MIIFSFMKICLVVTWLRARTDGRIWTELYSGDNMTVKYEFIAFFLLMFVIIFSVKTMLLQSYWYQVIRLSVVERIFPLKSRM